MLPSAMPRFLRFPPHAIIRQRPPAHWRPPKTRWLPPGGLMERNTDRHTWAMLDRRALLLGASAAAGALALPGMAFGQSTPRRGGTLRVAMPFNPASVDPMTGRNLPDFNVLYA